MRIRNRIGRTLACLALASEFLSAGIAIGKAPPNKASQSLRTRSPRDVRVVKMDELSVTVIHVHLAGTVISFPVKPTKVVLGNQKVFDVENVETDLAIAALTPNAAAHMFVYMFGRRFSFDLRTAASGGDKIVVVEDGTNRRMPVVIE